MPHPLHSSRLDHPNNINAWISVQKSSISFNLESSPFTATGSLARSVLFPSTELLEVMRICFHHISNRSDGCHKENNAIA